MRVRHRALDLKLRHTFRIARGASDVRQNVLVEIEDGPHVGLGEAAPIKRYGEDQESAGRAVAQMGERLGDVRAFADAAARAAVPGQRSAKNASEWSVA